MARAILGLAAAAALAVVLIVPTIFGVETWKWALGVLGAALFVAAGRRK